MEGLYRTLEGIVGGDAIDLLTEVVTHDKHRDEIPAVHSEATNAN
jgi:hypothetical protein